MTNENRFSCDAIFERPAHHKTIKNSRPDTRPGPGPDRFSKLDLVQDPDPNTAGSDRVRDLVLAHSA